MYHENAFDGCLALRSIVVPGSASFVGEDVLMNTCPTHAKEKPKGVNHVLAIAGVKCVVYEMHKIL